MSFCIVALHLDGSEELVVVHRNWILGDKCFWPPFWKDNKKLQQNLLSGVYPDTKVWDTYTMHIVRNKFYDSYNEARNDLKFAENGSDWSSSEQAPDTRLRKRRPGPSHTIRGDTPSPKRNRQEPTIVLKTPPRPPSFFTAPSVASQGVPTMVAVDYNFSIGESTTSQLPEPVVYHLGTGAQLLSSPEVESGTVTLNDMREDALSLQGQQVNPCIPSGHGLRRIPVSAVSTPTTGNVVNLCAPGGSYNNGNLETENRGPSLRDLAATVQSMQNSIILMGANINLALDMLRTLLQTKNCANPVFSGGLELPLKSIEDFRSMNERISQDPGLRDALITTLQCRGGETQNQVTHRIMAALMTDELMTTFTFVGQTGKNSFKDTMFLQAVCESVRKTPKGSVASDKEIEAAINYYLRKASSRIEAAKQKQERAKTRAGQRNADIDPNPNLDA